MEALYGSREILNLLPHRFPFLLVDKVVSWEKGPDPNSRAGQKIVAIKNVTFNEPYFPGHFPGMPIMPGVLQIEAIAQAACLAYLRPGDAKFDFFIASISEARFRKPVLPGDTLTMHVELVKDRGSIIMLKGRAEDDGQLVVEAEIMAKVSPQGVGPSAKS